MHRDTRRISWVKAARKAFEAFPARARERVFQALDIAAEGRKADVAKPLKGLGAGVFEIALRYRKDAFRVVYAVRIGEEIWVVHAFRKKSQSGMATPKEEIDVIRQRLQSLKEQLK